MLYSKDRGGFITTTMPLPSGHDYSEFQLSFLKDSDVVVVDERRFKPTFGRELARAERVGYSEATWGFYNWYTYFEVARTLEEGDNVVYHGRSDASNGCTPITRVIVKNGHSFTLCTRWMEEGVLKEHVYSRLVVEN